MSATKAGFWLAAMMILGILLILGCDERKGSTVAVVAPPANVKARDGIAVALLVDCSGSMADAVSDNGFQHRKDEIARRCVTELVKRCDDFQTKNPTRAVELALFSFNDKFSVALDFATPNVAGSESAIQSLYPGGGTGIGNAVLKAKERIDLTGLSAKHIVIVTDGQNTAGVDPAVVANAFKALPESQRPAVYVVAFDTNADYFQPLKSAGWMVLSASNGKELQRTLDTVFGENILLEKP